jgi:predicted nicotinamide N-methyase
MISHVLDLPNLRQRPDADSLVTVLNLVAPRRTKNFHQSDDQLPLDGQGLFMWLTALVGSSLDWIAADETKEHLWHLASIRLSERCGRTAQPDLEREMEITLPDGSKLDIVLKEPSLTSDSLGLKTWGSSFVVANRLAREHHQLLKDPVLELGSGTGLSGIVAAKLGHTICVTDLPEIIDNLRVNVELNCFNDEKIAAEVLDWMDPSGFPYSDESFASILIADPIYSPAHPRMVCDMVAKYLSRKEDSQVCVQLPLRAKYEHEREVFYQLLESTGLQRLRYEVETGADDFGEMEFAWSLWKWRSTNGL